MDQNMAGTSGWWMCSLYGRHGLAPANRLQLLPQTGTTAGPLSHVTEKPKLIDAKTDDSAQNIYQIPSVPRPSSSPAYERMDMIYKVPSTPLSSSKTPVASALQHSTEGPEGNKVCFIYKYDWIYVEKSENLFYCSEVKVGPFPWEVFTLMIREVDCCRNATLWNPCWKKSLQMGTRGLYMGTGMQHRGFYGPVKDKQTQTSDTFNCKQQPKPPGTPERQKCLYGCLCSRRWGEIYPYVHHFLSCSRGVLFPSAVAT